MKNQLQDACAPVAVVTRFGGTDSLQHQVVSRVAVSQRNVAQHLRSEKMYAEVTPRE